MKKLSITKRLPHVVILLKNSKSPTDSIYKRFDIVKQTKVLNTFGTNSRVIRCQEPFIIAVSVNGKTRNIASKCQIKGE